MSPDFFGIRVRISKFPILFYAIPRLFHVPPGMFSSLLESLSVSQTSRCNFFFTPETGLLRVPPATYKYSAARGKANNADADLTRIISVYAYIWTRLKLRVLFAFGKWEFKF